MQQENILEYIKIMTIKYAVIINRELEIADIVSFEWDNDADDPLYAYGDAWSWIETFETYEEAEEYTNSFKF